MHISRIPSSPRKRATPVFAGWLLALVMVIPVHGHAQVVVTLPPLAGLVAMLDTEDATSCLLAGGADPHSFQISPRQAEALKAAALFVRSPGDDGGWSIPADHPHTLALWRQRNHAWLVPGEVRQVLPRLAESLKALHPDRAAAIDARLASAGQQVDRIDQAWRKALQPLKKTGVIVQHPSWQPLFATYGVPVLAVLESPHHAHEAGPHALEDALKLIKAHPDAWLVGDIRHSNRALEWLARHQSGTNIFYLDALGECGTTWEALMETNIRRLQQP